MSELEGVKSRMEPRWTKLAKQVPSMWAGSKASQHSNVLLDGVGKAAERRKRI